MSQTQIAARYLARVLSVVLDGFSTATSTAVTAADTVLSAIGKLQAQVSLKSNSANAAFTGTAIFENIAASGTVAGKKRYLEAPASRTFGAADTNTFIHNYYDGRIYTLSNSESAGTFLIFNSFSALSQVSAQGALIIKPDGALVTNIFLASGASVIVIARSGGAWVIASVSGTVTYS